MELEVSVRHNQEPKFSSNVKDLPTLVIMIRSGEVTSLETVTFFSGLLEGKSKILNRVILDPVVLAGCCFFNIDFTKFLLL